MAISVWWCISLVVLVDLACDASAQRLSQLPLQKPPAPALQRPQQPPLRPTAEAPSHRCEVEEVEMVMCGTPDITEAQCEVIHCCYSSHSQKCYYGKAVTMQCTRDGQFVVVVARDSTLPSLDLDSVSLLGGQDPPCSPVGITAAFVIFQFPVTACGTTGVEDDGYVIYENYMVSSYETVVGPQGSISRDSHFELMFQCRYSSTAVDALVIEVKLVPGPVSVTLQGALRVELRLASGQCFSKGCVEEEEAYSSFYSLADYPVTKALRQPLYAEVRILERTDPDLVLTLERCWATTTTDSLSLPQWELLDDGCSYGDDSYQTTVVPVDASSGLQYPTHHKRFILKMFTFVDPDTLVPMERVFIHCNAAVCYPSANDSCVQRCNRRGMGRTSSADMRKNETVSSEVTMRKNETETVSSGEVTMTNSTKTN